jgi:RNA polymerase primary sigma factor
MADMSDGEIVASIKRLVVQGRERGYLTFDEVNAVLPTDRLPSAQLDDILCLLREIGVTLVDNPPERA